MFRKWCKTSICCIDISTSANLRIFEFHGFILMLLTNCWYIHARWYIHSIIPCIDLIFEGTTVLRQTSAIVQFPWNRFQYQYCHFQCCRFPCCRLQCGHFQYCQFRAVDKFSHKLINADYQCTERAHWIHKNIKQWTYKHYNLPKLIVSMWR